MLVVVMRTSVGSGLGHSANRTERGAEFLGEELRLLPGGEVPALVDLVEVDDVRIRLLDPAARRPPDLAGERRESDRDPNLRWRRLAGPGGVRSVGLPIRPG